MVNSEKRYKNKHLNIQVLILVGDTTDVKSLEFGLLHKKTPSRSFAHRYILMLRSLEIFVNKSPPLISFSKRKNE